MPRKKWQTQPSKEPVTRHIEDDEELEPVFARTRTLLIPLHAAAGRRRQVYPSLAQDVTALAGLYRVILWMFWQRIRYGRAWQYHLAYGVPRHQRGRSHQGTAS